MSKVLRFKRPRRRRNDEEARVKRLRIVASRLGYELVSPWCAKQRHIPGHGTELLAVNAHFWIFHHTLAR